jgi:hypothetical protein
MMRDITLRHIIDYKSQESDDPKEYKRQFEKWLKDRNLEGFIKRGYLDYVRHHQDATRRILEDAGLSPEVIDYAAGHHPAYFSERERFTLPKECCIIEVADKFNAIIQSEGVRRYISKRTMADALNIIVHELSKEFKGYFHQGHRVFERDALAVIAKRHLPIEVNSYTIPQTAKLIRRLRMHVAELKVSDDDAVMKEAERMVALIAATLAVSKELGDILSGQELDFLQGYELQMTDLIAKEQEKLKRVAVSLGQK